MRIVQLLPTISFGDAVGNDTRALRRIIADLGYETEIYAENIDDRLPDGTAKRCGDMPPLSNDDVLIYHVSTGTRLNFDLPKLGGRKMLIYHNITPAKYFEGYSPEAVRLTGYGYEGVRFLADKVEYCVADSDYNRQDLRRMGYACPIDVCPILIPFSDYDKEPDASVLAKYRGDGWTNLLFVGRIAPNKRQEDVIRAFFAYHRDYNAKSRLFLVGSSNGMERYEAKLRTYTQRLGIGDSVLFPGHIRFDAILAYYKLADVFVCMSEHEGFCVPLVEAMYFDKPIVAYGASAISGTLGKGGLLLQDKDPHMAAAVIDRVVRDAALRTWISERQREKMKEYRYDAVKDRFIACLDRLLNSGVGVRDA